MFSKMRLFCNINVERKCRFIDANSPEVCCCAPVLIFVFYFVFLFIRALKSVQNFKLKGWAANPVLTLFPVMGKMEKVPRLKFGKPARKFP